MTKSKPGRGEVVTKRKTCFIYSASHVHIDPLVGDTENNPLFYIAIESIPNVDDSQKNL